MDNSLMIGLARQITLRRSVDIAANNIANMNTAGFKAEHELVAEEPMGRARDIPGGQQIRYVVDWGLLRDFRTGALEHTGRPFDLAIQGDGFFQVGAGEDVQYTRDGRFVVNQDSALAAYDGALVLDAAGGPVILPANAEQITISPGGAVLADGVEVARLAVIGFDNLSALEKTGGGRLIAPEEAGARPLETPDIRQGFYESSNVNPVLELTRMMEVTRSYQTVSQMLEQQADLSRRAIERLGRAQS